MHRPLFRALGTTIAAVALAGCAASPPLKLAQEVALKFPTVPDGKDSQVYCVSEGGRLYLGHMVAPAPPERSRTVLREIGAGGKEASRISFPPGAVAQAVRVDREGFAYAVCQVTNPLIEWRILKLAPGGEAVWDRPIPRLEEEGFHLTFSIDDWRNCLIVKGPGRDELSFLWYRTSARPDVGIISFTRSEGRVTRLEDGVRTFSGGGYQIEPTGVSHIEKAGPPTPLLEFEGRPWALDFFRGRLYIQVSDDEGKTGYLYTLDRGEAVQALSEPVRFPVRDNASFLYSVDPLRGAGTIYRIEAAE